MKIWLDLRTRFTKNNFLLWEIINIFIDKIAVNKENNYNLYIEKNINIKKEYDNINVKYLDYWVYSIQNQINFRKLLKQDDNDLDIFFGIWRPILYKWNDLIIVNNLDNLLYETQEVNNFAKKFKYLFLLEHSCLYAKKILTFNKELKLILNEKLNIEEDKINVIYPFFFKRNIIWDGIISQKNNFIIYNSWSWKENLWVVLKMIFEYNKKNLEKIDLIIIWDDYDDIIIRKQVLSYDLLNNVKHLENNDKRLNWYYKNAIAIIYPTFYENFPIELNDALFYKTPIIAAKTESVKEVFHDKVFYFKYSSSLDLEKTLIELIQNNVKEVDYKEILEKYSLENFVSNFFNKKIL
jgi:hypothetical protein